MPEKIQSLGQEMTETTHKLLNGRAIAGQIRADVEKDVSALKAEGWPVRLISISVGDTEAAQLYVRNQQRAAEKVGMDFEARDYPADIGAEELLGIVSHRDYCSAPNPRPSAGAGHSTSGSPFEGC